MINTNIVYPSYLPPPVKAGYSRKNISPTVRTNLQNGRSRVRRKFTAVPVEQKLQWIFDNGRAAALFERWFKDFTKDGFEWFQCPLKTPLGFGMYVVRFIDIYDGPDMFGACGWTVSAEVEMYERPLMPSEWMVVPEMWLGMDIIDIAVNREWPEA